MFNHFDKYMNTKALILKHKPSHVVECGALFGKNTELLIALKNELDVPYRLTVITDNNFSMEGIDNLIRGISYKVLKDMDDDSIDMCLIDTDHNYLTLAKELTALHPKLKKDGLILMHDVEAFYHDIGFAGMYFNGDNYPSDEVKKVGAKYGGIGNALMDFLSANRFDYKMIYYTQESCGGAVIQKVMRRDLNVCFPTEEKIKEISLAS